MALQVVQPNFGQINGVVKPNFGTVLPPQQVNGPSLAALSQKPVGTGNYNPQQPAMPTVQKAPSAPVQPAATSPLQSGPTFGFMNGTQYNLQGQQLQPAQPALDPQHVSNMIATAHQLPPPNLSQPATPTTYGFMDGSSYDQNGTPAQPKQESPAPEAAPPTPPAEDPTAKRLAALEALVTKFMTPSAEETQAQNDLNNLAASTRQGYTNIENKVIPMEFIANQSASLSRQAADLAIPLQARLATEQAKRQAGLDASKFALERADAAMNLKASQSKPVDLAAGASLVKYNPATGKYETVASGAPKPESLPASAQEYEYAKKNGYTGSYNDYQNMDANRKRSISHTTNVINSSGLGNKEATLFSGIVDKYNKSPLVAASDRTPVLQASIDQIKKDPSNGTLQLNLAYSYIQALDTYQSAVREGELGLVNSIDSTVGKLSNAVQQVQNGQIVRPEVALQIAAAAQNIVSTIKSAAQSKAQSFQSQANTLGLGNAWNQYLGGFTPSYQAPASPAADKAANYQQKYGY